MESVIIEYKSSDKVRLVESASERRAREYMEAQLARETKEDKVRATLLSSPDKEPVRAAWYERSPYTDTKNWKNQKHADKNWMRHIHRLRPSARILAEKCIYPNVCC